MENHLEQRLYQPRKLLEDLREADAQQFRTAMKCLLEDKKDRLVRRSWQGVGKVQDHLAFVELKWIEPDSDPDLSFSLFVFFPSPTLWELWT